MLCDIGGILLGGGTYSGTVTVSTFTINSVVSAENADVALKFFADGTTDEYEGTYPSYSPKYTQVNSGTDWIIPNGSASSLFQVKAEEVSATGLGTTTYRSPAGVGLKGLSTWYDLGSDREWGCAHTSSGTSEVWVLDFSIRYNGGPIIDTGRVTMNATDINP